MPLRDDLLNPIPGDNPSGANLRYDPVTDKIKEARREDLDVPQGEWKTALKTADYNLVIKLGSDTLAKRSKDLQIAVWLVDAHVHKEGFAVLAPALHFLRDFLEQFWDTLYPPVEEDGDMEVRAAPLVWLGAKLGEPLGFLPIVSGKLSYHKYQESRTVGSEADADTSAKQQARETAINEGKVTAEQFDEAAEATPLATLKETYRQLKTAQTAVEALGEFCDTQFGDFSPSFIKTRDAIEEIAQTVRIILSRKPGGLDEDAAEEGAEGSEEETAEASAEETSSSEDSFSAGTTTDWGSTESTEVSFGDAAAPGDMEGAARQLASLCRFMRSQDPENPAPYIMLRTFAWAGIMLNAPLLDRSTIEAPESELRVRLKRLTAEAEWDQLLEATEEAMLQPFARYWLDLQRYTMNALEQKGLASTARVVTNHFRVFLEIQPDIREVTLPDDTPAGNTETQNWIENFVIRQKVPRTAPAESGESTESSDSGDSFGSSSDSSDSFGTSSDDTSTDSFSLDSSSTDLSTSFGDTSTSTEETSSLETNSWDTPTEEAMPDLSAAAEPEPEPYTVEENPPILEAEEPPPSDISDEFGQALEAVRDGRTAEGLGMITSILATERSGRQRFRRRTQLAHLLMAAGKGKVAQPLLDQLATEIEERRLEEWEPNEAIAYPLELLLHCLTSADDERRTQLYTRICKLDPVRAVNCSF